MNNLKKQLIKIGSDRPSLRSHLRRIISSLDETLPEESTVERAVKQAISNVNLPSKVDIVGVSSRTSGPHSDVWASIKGKYPMTPRSFQLGFTLIDGEKLRTSLASGRSSIGGAIAVNGMSMNKLVKALTKTLQEAMRTKKIKKEGVGDVPFGEGTF